MYCSTEVIRAIRAKRMRLAVRVVRMRQEMKTRLWLQSMKEKGGLEDQGVDGMIIVKRLL